MKISKVSKLTNTPHSTIRYYESLNFIEPTERLENGYRIFNERHILQIKLCRLVFGEFVNKQLRKASLQVLYAAQQDMHLCRQHIEAYIALVQGEIQKADNAVGVIKKWTSPDGCNGCNEEQLDYTLKTAAECIGTTKDRIRNWERNGLLGERFSKYQRRIYQTGDIERMKIIYMLLETGHSIMAINKFFSALAQNNHNALQILIDPDKYDDLYTMQDRWRSVLMAAMANGMAMHALVS